MGAAQLFLSTSAHASIAFFTILGVVG